MQKIITISTRKKNELVDITQELKKIIKESAIENGLCNVYVPHATCAIVINENYDPNVCDDIINALNRLIPEGIWKHDRIDNNAAAHIKSAIIGPSEVIPIKNGILQLGRWQSLMFLELDGPRSDRKVIVTIIEDK